MSPAFWDFKGSESLPASQEKTCLLSTQRLSWKGWRVGWLAVGSLLSLVFPSWDTIPPCARHRLGAPLHSPLQLWGKGRNQSKHAAPWVVPACGVWTPCAQTEFAPVWEVSLAALLLLRGCLALVYSMTTARWIWALACHQTPPTRLQASRGQRSCSNTVTMNINAYFYPLSL